MRCYNYLCFYKYCLIGGSVVRPIRSIVLLLNKRKRSSFYSTFYLRYFLHLLTLSCQLREGACLNDR